MAEPVRFDLGSMGEPLRKLRNCAADVARKLQSASLGGDGKARAAVPASNPGQWITSGDYPRDLVRQGMDGVIAFRLTVNKSGKPTACFITASNRPQMFDDTVCLALMKRATFKPALDSQGNPQASYFSSRVRFQLP